jgi:hypothetical protein
MNAPAIRPTITQRVRRFLAREGACLRPWAGLEETYDELYALLRRRRDDPEFWPPLTDLLQEIIESAVDRRRPGRLAPDQAELLGSWKVDELVAELRQALPRADGATPSAQFAQGLSAAVLGGFLLIGLAACDTPLDVSNMGGGGNAGLGHSGGTAGMSVATAGAGTSGGGGAAGGGGAGGQSSCTLDPASLLKTTIDGSSLTTSQKDALCGCFAKLSTGWSTSLTSLFETGTPQQIAAELQNLLACCGANGINTTDQGTGSATPSSWDLTTIQQGNPGDLCRVNVPVYKGVSFPD